MSNHITYTSFDATTVTLEGSNLIEASAGTGKTYSIAILALRLIIEKRMSVKEILMVTFTKAAVAELEERIRLFIRKAYKSSLGDPIDDVTISGIVSKAMGADQKQKEQVQQDLKAAVLLLDETSVLTIHSFCQQTLHEFAFETKQIFGAETLQDTTSLLTDEVNKFWRSHVTVLNPGLLDNLLSAGFCRSDILSVLKDHLAGKSYMVYESGKDYLGAANCWDTFSGEVAALKQQERELNKCLEQYIADNRAELERICNSNTHARKGLLDLLTHPAKFLKAIREKRSSQYIVKLFPGIIEQLDECDGATSNFSAKLVDLKDTLICIALQSIDKNVRQYKVHRNLLTFDDLITRLQAAINPNSGKLIEGLQTKYRAVFVDEFQDTDRLQYDIFHQTFSSSTVFYIGDPKQSIYAWRKADIFTYFEARNNVARVFGMNQNFRSSAPFIEAMNQFFDVEDPFYFRGASDAIEYIPVDTPSPNTKGVLTKSGGDDIPLTIIESENKPGICNMVVSQIISLLDDQVYKIRKGDEWRKLRPSDIGILVRSNREGQQVSDALGKRGIPSVTIGDEKILTAPETKYLWFILVAIDNPSKANVNRALYSPFTGFTKDQILRLDEEAITDLFKTYKKNWEEEGVYTALMDFVADFNVRTHLTSGEIENSDRIIANLFHLAELVHKTQLQKNFTPLELISWLKRGMDGMEVEGDEYEQRMESDEDAIQIITIHKSKGLEYNVVLAPFLDLQTDGKHITHVSFRHAETGEYVSREKALLTEEQKEWLQEQNEQENRRLIYVALTRAVYKCFIFKNTSKDGAKSSLQPFIQACRSKECSLIEFATAPEAPPGYRYVRAGDGHTAAPILTAAHHELAQNTWQRTSYSNLTVKPAFVPSTGTIVTSDEYDQFVFNVLTRGKQTGTMLHYIFERIHFNNPERWITVVTEALNRFAVKKKEAWLLMLLRLLEETLNSPIKFGRETFKLSDIAYQKRLHEFEFDFPLPLFSPQMLNQLGDNEIIVRSRPLAEMEGMMNGKIDLFFEHNGKYYVLDWKSNFLGFSVEDYDVPQLARVMNESNYHLQYLIYSVAAKKYLESRLGEMFNYEAHFGGVIYCFVRGMRKEGENGVFTYKPSLAQLDKVSRILQNEWVGPKEMAVSFEEVPG